MAFLDLVRAAVRIYTVEFASVLQVPVLATLGKPGSCEQGDRAPPGHFDVDQ
ncbi:hypothetical protein G4G28_06095 [Massilia sp. Dwa41.01b]|uniref:hypothetical protein n=1 Tax=unclassified Massilia TaxID=2609279 RepID=UPI001604919F|nr:MULTISPECIES: hypothetical protein [unclassified Massilia]QNA88174.1 hypothetical protein G4G28_06095 [Massilia sp. Dwa41.01b]QNA99080.1 hypothetical protein G4G31_09820 [Massilia sp. Se16.2.3]